VLRIARLLRLVRQVSGSSPAALYSVQNFITGSGPKTGAFKQLDASLRVFEAAEATIESAHTRALGDQLRGVWPAMVDGL
jgi:hypothetical protein